MRSAARPGRHTPLCGPSPSGGAVCGSTHTQSASSSYRTNHSPSVWTSKSSTPGQVSVARPLGTWKASSYGPAVVLGSSRRPVGSWSLPRSSRYAAASSTSTSTPPSRRGNHGCQPTSAGKACSRASTWTTENSDRAASSHTRVTRPGSGQPSPSPIVVDSTTVAGVARTTSNARFHTRPWIAQPSYVGGNACTLPLMTTDVVPQPSGPRCHQEAPAADRDGRPGRPAARGQPADQRVSRPPRSGSTMTTESAVLLLS